jgi:hypothetical protein
MQAQPGFMDRMVIKSLSLNDQKTICAEYRVSTIYDVIWCLLRYALARQSKTLHLSLHVERGFLELQDDGEGMPLQSLHSESKLFQSNPCSVETFCVDSSADLRALAKYELATSSGLGLYASTIDEKGAFREKMAPLERYRNRIIVQELYTRQPVRLGASKGMLSSFVYELKIAMIMSRFGWNALIRDLDLCFIVQTGLSAQGRAKLLLKKECALVKRAFPDGSQCEYLVAVLDKKAHAQPVFLANNVKCDPFRFEPEEGVVLAVSKTLLPSQNPTSVQRSVSKAPRKPSFVAKPIASGQARKPIASNQDKIFGDKHLLDVRFQAPRGTQILSGPANRASLDDLVVVGQFDRKCIAAKRRRSDGRQELWLFDQHASDERVQLEALQTKYEGQSRDLEELKMRACKSAVRFGDRLSDEQMRQLLNRLAICRDPFHCAHGRPTCWLLAVLNG